MVNKTTNKSVRMTYSSNKVEYLIGVTRIQIRLVTGDRATSMIRPPIHFDSLLQYNNCYGIGSPVIG
jgi:hypothetical protein